MDKARTSPVSGWEVEVRINGEPHLTIGHNHLAGDPEINEEIVERCALHLLSFLGRPVGLAQTPDLSQGLKKAMEIVGEMRMSEAGIFDEKHSGQRGEDRSNALYDAYVAIRFALAQGPDTSRGEK